MKKAFLTLVVASFVHSQCSAALVALSSFGGGDGWRAPKETVTGDVAGTTTGADYTYLGVSGGERGFAYNPITGNLVLVARPTTGGALAAAATAPIVRILNGTTGADIGGLNMAGVATGGAGILLKAGVSSDGAIYAANATTNIGANVFKIYKWNSEASGLTSGGNVAPTNQFNGTIAGFAGTPRVGDTFDVTGTSANPTFVSGVSGGAGYAIISGSTGHAVATITPNTSPTGPTTNDFSRSVTFTNNATTVWGKGIGSTVTLWETTYTLGAAPAATGTRTGTTTVLGSNQAPMDYLEIQGVPYLAVLDYGAIAGTTSTTNRANIFIYDVSNPTAPVLVDSGSTVPTGLTIGAQAAGFTGGMATAVGAGHVAWGGSTVSGSNLVTRLYAMATNQGIQAFEFSVPLAAVPEIGSFAAVGFVGLLTLGMTSIRRRGDDVTA